MDRATEMANDAFYLDNHLKAVAQRIETQGQIELFGVGVGLDLSPYPNLVAYRARVGARPAVVAAMKAEGLIKA